jgi:thiol-disulfide isomerase/thioredoxin
MSDGTDETKQGSRTRMLVITGVSVLAAGVIVAGVIAAGGRDSGTVDLGGDRAQAATTAPARTGTAPAPAANEPPAPAEPALQGTGAPIRISGTDPVTGRPVDLADFRGKPTVLAIWASWCHGCNEEAPHLAKVAAARDDVNFVGLNYRDDASGAKDFTGKYGWTFPNIADGNGEIAFGLGLQGTPTTIFLDAQHREIGRIVGAADEAGFTEAVDQITATRPAAQ